MTQFPIAEQIRGGAPVVTPDWWPEGDTLAEGTNWFDLTTRDDVAFFDISVASDLYWKGRKSYYNLSEDFGPLSPPFPAMWMEWTVPHGAHMSEHPDAEEIEQIETLIGVRHAVFLYTHEYRPYAGEGPFGGADNELAAKMAHADATLIGGMMLIQDPDDERILNVPVVTVIAVRNEDGTFVDGTHQGAGDRRSLAKMREYLKPDMVDAVTKVDLNVPYMALNLLNCRNVTTRERAPAFRRSGSQKRRGEPGVKFRTIVLPGLSRQASAGGRKSRTDEATMALHRVRGHFKTYTAAAPLMGKHVGTYWWGWNMRGNSARGRVIADYEFKEGA